MNGRLLSIRESGHNHILDVSRISCLFLRTVDSFLVIAYLDIRISCLLLRPT